MRSRNRLAISTHSWAKCANRPERPAPSTKPVPKSFLMMMTLRPVRAAASV